ncbi:MAG: CBS domain-containing protein, partial [Anaerolineae bacterium]|nr:CBS domain-containing protein [Anaerolineae bacterium]
VMNFAPHPEKVRCILPNTSVSEAHNIIVKKVKYAFRHLIVTDTGKNRGKLLGVVGLRNLIEDISDPDSDIANTPVSKLMVKFDPAPKDEPNCIWLDENATVADALKTFDQRVTRDDAVGYYFYLSAIPIIEANNKFHSLSIISFKDILNAMLNGIIPIPNLTIEKMGYLKDVVTSDINGDPFAMKSKMNVAGKGQRDLPIINTEDKSLLLGLVPDHKLITNYYTGRKVGDVEVMAQLQFLRLQTPETTLEDMLKEYVSSDQSKIFYSFPVVSSKENPEFLGLVGYRDIFRALLNYK